MKQYQDYLKNIFENGDIKKDRTNVGTISYFGYQMKFDLKQGFPAITTKKLAWKSIVGELIWFLRGSCNELELREITYGDVNKKSIWADNANATYWKDKAKFDGDLGRIYGVQWRKHFANTGDIDQINNLITTLKNNPDDRRMIISAWNVEDVENKNMALPPCHCFVQFWTKQLSNGKRELYAQMYQRSCDSFLGVPFNIASYSLLIHIIAKYMDMEVGEFSWIGGDCHIYSNHIDQCKEIIARKPYQLPQLKINTEIDNNESFDDFINKMKVNDFELINYKHHEKILGEMAV